MSDYNNNNGYRGRGNNSYGGGGNNRGGSRSRTRARTFVVSKGDMKGSTGYNGWRPLNGGVSYSAFSRGTEVESKTVPGKMYEEYLVKIKPAVGAEYLATGFRTVTGPGSDRVRIPSENVVISPNSPNGGYCGPYLGKKNN